MSTWKTAYTGMVKHYRYSSISRGKRQNLIFKMQERFAIRSSSSGSSEKLWSVPGVRVDSDRTSIGIPHPGIWFVVSISTTILLSMMNAMGGSPKVKCTCRNIPFSTLKTPHCINCFNTCCTNTIHSTCPQESSYGISFLHYRRCSWGTINLR